MVDIISSIGIYENDLRRMKSMEGKKRLLKEGKWKGGNPPFGYKLKNGKLIEDKEESFWVREMYKMYDKGVSVRDIQQHMMKNGIKSPNGNPLWNLGSINLMLRKTSYIGKIKQTMGGEEFVIKTPPLIDKDLYNRVRKRVENLRIRNNQINRSSHFYLLREFLFSGSCKTPMSGVMYPQSNKYYYLNRNILWELFGLSNMVQ